MEVEEVKHKYSEILRKITEGKKNNDSKKDVSILVEEAKKVRKQLYDLRLEEFMKKKEKYREDVENEKHNGR